MIKSYNVGMVGLSINRIRKIRSSNKNSEKGFTLVELIVVLVILAILAAILVPGLLGYIDKARDKEDMLNARNVLMATQGEFTANYAKRKATDTCAVPGLDQAGTGSGKDISLCNTTFSKNVFATADDKPYIFFVGCRKYPAAGENASNARYHESYTVYFACYMETANSKPLFFDGTEWTKEYPWRKHKNADGNNTFYSQGRNVDLQLYIMAAPNNNADSIWDILKKKAD